MFDWLLPTFRRKRSMLTGTACPECDCVDTKLTGKKRRGKRRCQSCGYSWKQTPHGIFEWWFDPGRG